MIMEANVGIGIVGKEGKQAANNADFAIGQFKFLRRLLLVHGRSNYMRQAVVFLYSVHKNICITLTLYWFSYFAAVSGTSIYESYIYSGFNFMLGLPIIIFGMTDVDVPEQFVMDYPQAYSVGRTNSLLSPMKMASWGLNSFLYSVMVCAVCYTALYDTFKDYELYTFGTFAFTALVFSLQCKVAYHHHMWTSLHIFSMGISTIGSFLWIYVNNVVPADFYGVADQLFNASGGLYWFMAVFFGVPIFSLLIDLTGRGLQLFFVSPPEAIMREIALTHSGGSAMVAGKQEFLKKNPIEKMLNKI